MPALFAELLRSVRMRIAHFDDLIASSLGFGKSEPRVEARDLDLYLNP